MPGFQRSRSRSQERSFSEPSVQGASPDLAAHDDLGFNQDTVGNAMMLSMLSQGGGMSSTPLDGGVRSKVEGVTGANLGQARVHSGPEADSLTQAHGARALTAGSHIYLGQSGKSDFTMAHEATHVAQQSAGGGASVQARPLQVGDASSHHEQQADAVASAALGDGDDNVGRYSIRPAAPSIQLQPDGPEAPPAEESCDNAGGASTESERMAIVTKTNAWYDAMLEKVEAFRAWMSSNWNSYLHSTGGNYALAWGDNQAWNVISNVVGTAAGVLAPIGIGAIIGTEIAPGIGTAIGAVVGLVVSTVIAVIVTALGNQEAMETVDKILKVVGGESQSKANEFNEQAKKGRANAAKIRDHVIAFGTNTEHCADDVKAWSDYIDGEKKLLGESPAPTGSEIHDEMMKEWVLQHAGDEEDQNKETNSKSWDEAKEKYFGGDLEGIPDLFVKQSKYEFGKIGVDHTGRTDGWQATIEEKELNADEAKERYDSATMTFRSTANPDIFISYINDNNSLIPLAEEGEEKVRKNEFKLVATMDLTTADGTCYVDEWEYEFELTGDLSWYLMRSASFTVSPD